MPSTNPSTTACHHVSMSPSSPRANIPAARTRCHCSGEIAPAAICKAALRTARRARSARLKIHTLGPPRNAARALQERLRDAGRRERWPVGLAIPHARLAGLERTVAAFARSRTGIQWESVDGKPTHLVFLLAGPADLPGAYLKVLAGVSRLLSDERCRARLMEAESETELLL